MKHSSTRWTLTALAMAFAGMAQAGVLYSNNAGTPFVQSFDTTTGAQIFSFTASGSNGRGVVTVGDVVYTTDASTPFIGKFDRLTGAALGGFNVVGAPGGISTISFDGDNFWTSDYTGANKAYYVQNGTGIVLKTVTLANSLGFYDGLEYFKGKLIANRFDGGFRGGNQYSVYDTDGNLLQASFIDTTGHGNGTGIAFDGTNFYVSDVLNGRATIWSGLDGSFLGALTLAGSANLVEDLSFDFESRDDTCRVDCPVPEPGSLGLLGIALAGWVGARRKAKQAL